MYFNYASLPSLYTRSPGELKCQEKVIKKEKERELKRKYR